ncbi:elicitor-responsive protein 3-like [Tripterygium wilfordii]|uniref:elicitor-responsive protein 3-like n=1 Tax=Tripterygium wilfordii TaxID=458696 RepID=UPI0018F7F919|nr:elicitor-responsive protein 3-like [Tripterygium wilfordii]
MSMISGIQGQLLEVTVVGCNKLKDTEWISRQDPYVCIEYGSNKSRTRTCTDGGKNPTFQEKFVFTLIEGLRELNVVVWNSNTLTLDDYIGSGKIQLQKVLSQGYDDSAWPIQSKTGRYAGEVRLILHYSNANKPATSYAPSAPPYFAPLPQAPLYSMPPQAATAGYPPAATAGYPPPATVYPSPSPYSAYPPNSAYPPAAYPPPPQAAYPPPAYPPHAYPPPPQASPYYPPGPFPGLHFPPQY